MTEGMVAVVLIGLLFVLLAGGLWIGVALLGVAIAGMHLFTNRPIGDPMALIVWGSSSTWTLTALPLFVWMGEILVRTRVTQSLFNGLTPLVNWLPGRLLHVNTIGCTIFAAACGSSAATCAMIGKLTVPELRKRDYPESIVVGSLAGPATLGLLIPPSITMIVYGVSADVSITKLFVAGVLPGLALALMFVLYTALWSLTHTAQMPAVEEQLPIGQRLRQIRHLLPVVILIAAVIGTIYAGIATPTEAAAIGVVGALLLAVMDGSLNSDSFFSGIVGATQLYAMIALILIGSSFLTLAMGYIGLPRLLAGWISGMNLPVPVFVALLVVLYAILGCFLEGVSIVVLTIAIILPSVEAVGIDLLWFGVFIVLVVEMAQITPPVGINLFIIQGLTGVGLEKISRYALPFFLIMLVMVATIYLFPQLVLWLPSKL